MSDPGSPPDLTLDRFTVAVRRDHVLVQDHADLSTHQFASLLGAFGYLEQVVRDRRKARQAGELL
ncbi:hypothetical protein LAJ19_16190 (plasmid) [Deinococcus taeanensis]|uniref:hypothetical protein n=1 Tax=Deinococcus taeanensis TaxID=2737050 RepID=UPI001CDD7EBB|nr:hypothetical protein [Deinococcus taeanensis]UBV44700.1 hypothetical protein LAJ19_16190 [Deinococcus taeanensis]